jgi:hypothetical protein
MAKKRAGAPEAMPPDPPQDDTSATGTATNPPPPPPPPATPTSPGDPPASEAAGNGEKKRPTYKVGPILTDRNNSVECAVWANDVQTSDGKTFTVHNVTVQASYRDNEGTWKPTRSFRGSQLYALLYCLQRASDFILSQRDPANDCPF